MPKILIFAGSVRQEAFSRRYAGNAADAARAAGAEVTHLELADYELPMMNQDLEEAHGLPENAKKLKHLFREHDALIVASPEYNSSIPPLLKNVFDWVSRREQGDPPGAPVAYRDKVGLLLSSSAGALGGQRALAHVRQILANLGVLVLGEQVALAGADKAFDQNGKLLDPAAQKRLADAVKKLVETTCRLKGEEPPTTAT